MFCQIAECSKILHGARLKTYEFRNMADYVENAGWKPQKAQADVSLLAYFTLRLKNIRVICPYLFLRNEGTLSSRRLHNLRGLPFSRTRVTNHATNNSEVNPHFLTDFYFVSKGRILRDTYDTKTDVSRLLLSVTFVWQSPVFRRGAIPSPARHRALVSLLPYSPNFVAFEMTTRVKFVYPMKTITKSYGTAAMA